MLHSGKPFFVPQASALQTALETSPVSAHRRLLSMVKEQDALYRLDATGIPASVWRRLADEGGALMFFREIQMDGFVFGREVFFAANVAFMVNRRRPWRADFDPYIGRFSAMGITNKLVADNGRVVRADADGKEEAALSVDHVKSSVCFAALGCALGLFVLLGEICYSKTTTTMPRQKRPKQTVLVEATARN